ncbi:thiamine pyrophosphate-dependent enzyme [Teichococcus aestuarii]|uniref:thiamine pyrophosphate-dependent enzyme n=1 Tax=Teichococcus aestuarii TaxID=568898 RepID=UPI0036104502
MAVSFRRQDLFPNDHPLYAGDLGLRNPDAQRQAFAEADLVLALGTRLTDITTQGYSWPAPGQRLVHVCADPRFLGWLFPAELAIAAEACAVLAALSAEPAAAPPGRDGWNRRLRQLQEADSRATAGDFPDGLPFLRVAQLVGECAPADAIVTLDAGTFAAPFYRKLARRPPQRLLAPISGAMGFGVPAAVAAALRHPERTVICAVGDGGALMTGGELAVGMARRLPIKLLLSDNGSYASIRIHQERQHPGRVSGTDLANPDLGAGAPPSARRCCGWRRRRTCRRSRRPCARRGRWPRWCAPRCGRCCRAARRGRCPRRRQRAEAAGHAHRHPRRLSARLRRAALRGEAARP